MAFRYWAFLLFLAFGFSGLFAQTNVSGTLPSSTTWTLANSPYTITADVTLSAGDTLTIEPGVEIGFTHYTRELHINGTLISQGTLIDTIVFTGSTAPGRIILYSSGSGSLFSHTKFENLGVFNNPAINVFADSVEVRNCRFNDCEVGVTVNNGTSPIIDNCIFYSSSDYALKVLSGHPIFTNNDLNEGFYGILLQDSAVIENNTIRNSNTSASSYGLHVDANIYVQLRNNTFTNNRKDLIVHPAQLNDTIYDGNGLSIVHVDNKVIGATTMWHTPQAPESWYYELTGDVTVNNGDSLIMEPGVSIKFGHYTYDLLINGMLNSVGTVSDSIHYWGNSGRIRLNAQGSGSIIRYCRIEDLGAFNNAAIELSSDSVLIDHNLFYSCEVGVTVASGAKPIIDSCVFQDSHDYAMRVLNGEPTFTNNLATGGWSGIYLLDTAIILNNVIEYHNSSTSNTGIHIDDNIYPIIDNNTFSNNVIDVLTHPAVIDDTLYDNNGLSVVHIDNKVIGETTVWQEPVLPEDWYYALTGDVTVNAGDTLTMEPGLSIQFNHYATDLTINGTLISEGTAQDSIRYFTRGPGGRIHLTTSGSGSSLKYSSIERFGAFNNSGLRISADSVTIMNSTFSGCEVGIAVYSGVSPLIDSSLFENSSDYAMRVLNGSPTFQNSTVRGGWSGIYLRDTAIILNNFIENINSHTNPGVAGIHIYENIRPTITGNTFSNNHKDVLTHPAVVDDTLFDGNGLSVIHIENKTIGESTTWHAPVLPENFYYQMIGDVIVSTGDSLVVEPGVGLKFGHYTHDLIVNGTLISEGNAQDSIRYWIDNIGGRIRLTSSGSGSIVSYSRFENMGAFNGPALEISASSVEVKHSQFTSCEDGINVNGGVSTLIDSVLFENSVDYGIQVHSGSAVVSNSCFIGNNYGITVSINNSVDARNNWWGDVSGPYHTSLNALGLGDDVSDSVQFTPWSVTSPCEPDPSPLLDSLFPEDNAIDVIVGTQLKMKFNEDIQKGTLGRIQVKRTVDSSIVYDENITHSSIQVAGDSLILNPGILPAGTPLFVTVDSTSISDLNNNFYLGIYSNHEWNFTTEPDADMDGFTPSQGDCDDGDSLEFPGQIWYADLDNDTFGDPNNFLIQCERPPGYILDSNDCNDNDSLEFPGQIWYADLDNDSFGDLNNFLIQCARPLGYVLDTLDCNDNDSLEFPGQIWYADMDADGFGDPNNWLVQCARPPGYVLDSNDCDDADSLEFPGQVWYADLDKDTYGDPNNFVVQCDRPSGYILDTLDCDDTDSLKFPGQIWYRDADNDLFGNPLDSLIQCDQPLGYILDNTDCDDADSTIFPGAPELKDGKDNDCDGDIDEDFPIGIDKIELDQLLKIWPNPTNDRLTIMLDDRDAYTIKVVTIDGKIILQQPMAKPLVELDVSGLSPGLYMLVVSSQKHYKSSQFIKK